MQLSCLVVLSILSFSSVLCVANGKPCGGASGMVGKLKSMFTGRAGKSRRTQAASASAPPSPIRKAPTEPDNKTIFEEFKNQTLMPYFEKDTAIDSPFRRTLAFVAARKAALQGGEDNTEATAREFLNEFCLKRGSSGQKIELDDNYRRLARCRTKCTSLWGYVFVPETETSVFQVLFNAHGQLIPITEGALIITEKKPEKKKSKCNEPQPPKDPVKCVCNTTEDFISLMDAFGIDIEEFKKRKTDLVYGGTDYLQKCFANTNLKLYSDHEVLKIIKDLLGFYKVRLDRDDMTEKEWRKQLKSVRGESDEEADPEYWKKMENYWKDEEKGNSPTSEEYTKELLEKIGCLKV